MSYRFTGRIRGQIRGEYSQPLAGVLVRIYRRLPVWQGSRLVLANAQASLTLLSEATLQARQSMLLAEASTDAHGTFTFELSEWMYGGEAFDLDVAAGQSTVGILDRHRAAPPLQATVSTIQPMWQRTEGGMAAAWAYSIPNLNGAGGPGGMAAAWATTWGTDGRSEDPVGPPKPPASLSSGPSQLPRTLPWAWRPQRDTGPGKAWRSAYQRGREASTIPRASHAVPHANPAAQANGALPTRLNAGWKFAGRENVRPTQPNLLTPCK